MFAGLINQKRNSVDGTLQARRASFADQSKPPGFFGGLWHRYVMLLDRITYIWVINEVGKVRIKAD